MTLSATSPEIGPEAKAKLKGQSPEAVWLLFQDRLNEAAEENPDLLSKLAKKAGLTPERLQDLIPSVTMRQSTSQALNLLAENNPDLPLTVEGLTRESPEALILAFLRTLDLGFLEV